MSEEETIDSLVKELIFYLHHDDHCQVYDPSIVNGLYISKCNCGLAELKEKLREMGYKLPGG